MSLTVPLAVRIVTARQDRHITRDLRDLTFRSVVPGGFASLTMSLDRPLHVQPDEIDYYASVYVYGMDGRVAWEGRLEDPGRGVSGDGLVWEVAAIGPSAHVEDLTRPVIYVDRSVDRWRRQAATTVALETNSESVQDAATPGVRLRFARGTVVSVANHRGIEYNAIREAGQLLARFSYAWQMGVTDANLRAKVAATLGTDDIFHDIGWTTTPGSSSRVVVTDWIFGRDRLEFDIVRNTSALTVPDDDTWALFTGLVVRAVLFASDGTEKTTGYTSDTVLASEVVADVLARLLPRFDGAGSAIVPTTYQIQSLAYVDGVTARKILEDMMGFEPAYYWAAWESRDLGPGSRAPIRIAETFTRTSTDGWHTSDSGHQWALIGTPPATEYSINGTRGLHTHNATGIRHECRITSDRVDVDGRIGRVSIAAVPSGDLVEAGIGARIRGGALVDARLFFQTNNTVQIIVRQLVDGIETTSGSPTVPGVTATTPLSLRLQAIGNQLRARAWQSGTSEPTTWTVSLTTNLRVAGSVAVWSRLNTPNTNTLPFIVDFDDISFDLAATSRHRFEWTTWPTTVRYEADVVDGFDAPGSGQGLYDRVRVRWRDVNGTVRTIVRTQTVRELADAGITREGFVDIGSDRIQTDAEQAGDAFLAEHKAAPNAGRLTIARPIVDLIGGGMVHPWEIRPGNLIRVRGVLPRVDSLNATDRDGLTVFRIVGVTYRASSASAELELDSYPLTVARALADLQRGRR